MKLQTFIKSLKRWSALVLAGVLLTGCSRSVTWEEEVVLNTGETIWVRRHVSYSVRGEAGNPLDLNYIADRDEEISFQYGDKDYRYKGDAQLMLIAISPDRRPVLVAPAAGKSWDSVHFYRCTLPHYVQLVPDKSGTTWHWPEDVEKWVYLLPANLMQGRKPPAEMKRSYSAKEKSELDKGIHVKSPMRRYVDPNYFSDNCKGRVKP
jgi:hypothetical protein